MTLISRDVVYGRALTNSVDIRMQGDCVVESLRCFCFVTGNNWSLRSVVPSGEVTNTLEMLTTRNCSNQQEQKKL